MTGRELMVKVEMPTGECHMFIAGNLTVSGLKWKIQSETKLPPRLQRLFFAGLELEEMDMRVNVFADAANTPISIQLAERFDGQLQTYFIDEKLFAPIWHRDFSAIKRDHKNHRRGGRPYYRPLGCMRYGLKVLGKYDSDDWLGLKGVPDEERSEEEWPVSYHGTMEVNCLSILRNGFDIMKGKRFAFGKGIYSSPDVNIALSYGSPYEFNGNHYKLVFQCRVDPKVLAIHNVGLHTGASRNEYWVVPNGDHIRPYAICAFPSKKEDRPL